MSDPSNSPPSLPVYVMFMAPNNPLTDSFLDASLISQITSLGMSTSLDSVPTFFSFALYPVTSLPPNPLAIRLCDSRFLTQLSLELYSHNDITCVYTFLYGSLFIPFSVVQGDGSSTRSWVYVDDVTSALDAILHKVSNCH